MGGGGKKGKSMVCCVCPHRWTDSNTHLHTHTHTHEYIVKHTFVHRNTHVTMQEPSHDQNLAQIKIQNNKTGRNGTADAQRVPL